MSNKNIVEDFLSQIFGTEDWINNSQKSLQVLFDNYTSDETVAQENSYDEDETSKIETKYELKPETFNENEFEQIFRMKKSTALDLHRELNNLCDDLDTNLLVCLWILGNTRSFGDISIILKIKQERLYEICEECFIKIISISSQYIYWPTCTEILAIEKGFLLEYKFPGVIGTIGSLHFAVYVSTTDFENDIYYNKSTRNFTIVLQAVCDNSLLFRDIFVGYPGSNSIETILKASPLYSILTDEDSDLKKYKKHLLGGTKHPQLPTLLTPYSIPKNRKLTDRESKFNSLHSSVMYTVEKTFRMVENRFPRMKSLDTTSPKFASLAAAAICTLHNFCRLRNDNSCC